MSTPTDGPPVRDLPPLRPLLPTPEGVTVHGFEAAGIDEASTWWEWLRAIHPETGLWPVVWDAEVVDYFIQTYDLERQFPPADAAAIPDELADLAAGVVPDPPPGGWERADWEEESADFASAARAEAEADGVDLDRSGFGERLGQPRRLLVALVPAADCWDVFEVVHFGNFNECPPAAVHAAVIRRWHERWGVELFAMTNDTVEFVAARPPATEAEAMGLGWEFSWYTETFDRSAYAASRSLVNRRRWIAWWD